MDEAQAVGCFGKKAQRSKPYPSIPYTPAYPLH